MSEVIAEVAGAPAERIAVVSGRTRARDCAGATNCDGRRLRRPGAATAVGHASFTPYFRPRIRIPMSLAASSAAQSRTSSRWRAAWLKGWVSVTTPSHR